MRTYVIGIDPGLTTGIALLDLQTLACELVQCSPGVVLPIVTELATSGVIAVLAVERFVVGPRAARSSTPRAGAITRELIVELTAAGEHFADKVVLRSAAEVKPWATDQRLERAGLKVRGMPHAVDGARHALFSAVKDCGLPDPLSKRSTPAPRQVRVT
jgi:hypothetical protein